MKSFKDLLEQKKRLFESVSTFTKRQSLKSLELVSICTSRKQRGFGVQQQKLSIETVRGTFIQVKTMQQLLSNCSKDFIIRVREVFLEEDLKEHSIMEIDDSDDDIIVVGSSTASVPAKRKAPSNDRPKNPKVKVITRRISAPKSSKNDVILLD